MSTTIQVGDENKQELEALIEKHGLRSKDEAVSFLIEQANNAEKTADEVASLENQLEKLEMELDQTPPAHEQHTQIYTALGMEWGLSVPVGLAEVLLTESTSNHLFTLFERDSPYLQDPQTVGRVMGLSVYAFEQTRENYLFVYHQLGKPKSPRAAFAVKSEYYEDELMNIVESGDWAAAPGGIPRRADVSGTAQPTFGSIGRPATDNERSQLYEMREISTVIENRVDDEADSVDIVEAIESTHHELHSQ